MCDEMMDMVEAVEQMKTHGSVQQVWKPIVISMLLSFSYHRCPDCFRLYSALDSSQTQSSLPHTSCPGGWARYTDWSGGIELLRKAKSTLTTWIFQSRVAARAIGAEQIRS